MGHINRGEVGEGFQLFTSNFNPKKLNPIFIITAKKIVIGIGTA